jgi:hypothetical protein
MRQKYSRFDQCACQVEIVLCSEREWKPFSEGIAARLKIIDSPVAFAVISHLQQPVLWIMTLAAAGASQVPAPVGALVVVIFRHREGCPAAAGDEKHLEAALISLGHILASLSHQLTRFDFVQRDARNYG